MYALLKHILYRILDTEVSEAFGIVALRFGPVRG
jgi:hypothetical protein